MAAMVLMPAVTAGEKAAVWEYRENLTGTVGAARLLQEAGFEVLDLPRDTSPADLGVDLIVLGSFVSEVPAYPRYMKQFGEELKKFVAGGGVLLQLCQNHDVEPSPPFLPEGLSAERGSLAFTNLAVNPDGSPLLEGLTFPTHYGREFPLPGHPLAAASRHAFMDQEGFHVLLWSDTQIPFELPALLEAAHGKGRILLTSMFLDKLYGPDGISDAAESFIFAAGQFFRNLHTYVEMKGAGELPEPTASIYNQPEPLEFVKGSWSLVLLPDPQNYARAYPEISDVMSVWTVKNRDRLDIRYVITLGDLTNNNTPDQWRNARRSLGKLDGKVPYVLTTGNHDYLGPDHRFRITDRGTLLNKFFTEKQYRNWKTFGGVFEEGRLENNFHLFEAGGRGWIIIALEWLPREEVVRWAAGLLEEYADRSAILVTHEYLAEDDTRILLPRKNGKRHPVLAPLNDAGDLWVKLVSRYPNVVFILSGHVTGDGAGRAISEGVNGNKVHEMMVNFQMRLQGGQGYLRLLEFMPDGKTVQVRTYSPYLDRFMTSDEHQFRLELPPAPVH